MIVVPLVSDQVGKPEDRLCNDMVHLILQNKYFIANDQRPVLFNQWKSKTCAERVLMTQ